MAYSKTPTHDLGVLLDKAGLHLALAPKHDGQSFFAFLKEVGPSLDALGQKLRASWIEGRRTHQSVGATPLEAVKLMVDSLQRHEKLGPPFLREAPAFAFAAVDPAQGLGKELAASEHQMDSVLDLAEHGVDVQIDRKDGLWSLNVDAKAIEGGELNFHGADLGELLDNTNKGLSGRLLDIGTVPHYRCLDFRQSPEV